MHIYIHTCSNVHTFNIYIHAYIFMRVGYVYIHIVTYSHAYIWIYAYIIMYAVIRIVTFACVVKDAVESCRSYQLYPITFSSPSAGDGILTNFRDIKIYIYILLATWHIKREIQEGCGFSLSRETTTSLPSHRVSVSQICHEFVYFI